MSFLAKKNKYSGFFTGKYWEFAHDISLTDTMREYGNKLLMEEKIFMCKIY
jgi:hypothetical protein